MQGLYDKGAAMRVLAIGECDVLDQALGISVLAVALKVRSSKH